MSPKKQVLSEFFPKMLLPLAVFLNQPPPIQPRLLQLAAPSCWFVNLQAAFIHQLTCSDKPTCEAAEATPGKRRNQGLTGWLAEWFSEIFGEAVWGNPWDWCIWYKIVCVIWVPAELLSFNYCVYVSCLHVQRNLKMELICLGLQ